MERSAKARQPFKAWERSGGEAAMKLAAAIPV